MNILYTTCTKQDPDGFNKTPLGKSVQALNLKCLAAYNNSEGIPLRYNRLINTYSSDYDAIVFVHDDVYLNDWLINEKLEEAFKKFDIVGVAGAASFSAKSQMVAWHAAPQQDWSGGCFHAETNKSEDLLGIYYTNFGKFNRHCAVIDGLFMAAKRSVFEAGVRFREEFTFDFYDASFCIESHYKKMKIGTAPIMLTHLSHGAGIQNKSYMDAQAVFKKIYLKEGQV